MTDPPLNVVLYAPRIPQNTGQIARTCLAMNLQLHLIRPLGFRLDESTLRRAGVGYWEEIEPRIHEDGDAFWNSVADPARVFLISKHGKRTYTDAGFREGDYLLFGNESEGLPPEWLERRPGSTLVIGMKNPGARCLNLATAASVVIFEALRQIEST